MRKAQASGTAIGAAAVRAIEAKLIIIGSVYEGGKYDKRNQGFAAFIEIAFPSIDELCELFLRAGYSEVQMFEKYNRGWVCGIGRKPL